MTKIKQIWGNLPHSFSTMPSTGKNEYRSNKSKTIDENGNELFTNYSSNSKEYKNLIDGKYSVPYTVNTYEGPDYKYITEETLEPNFTKVIISSELDPATNEILRSDTTSYFYRDGQFEELEDPELLKLVLERLNIKRRKTGGYLNYFNYIK